jgi:Xaa-Pro aminopeptidase
MGSSVDSFARQYLWDLGLNFKHGVGHGVSHCGPVHEYPHYAYSRNSTAIPLKEGMIITNEPGYYKEGSYGIRIENILTVDKAKQLGYLKFRSLTLVPYCNNLIIKDLLEKKHI